MAATALERERMGLLVASRLWATCRDIDEERVRAARHALLLANHHRYLKTVGMYARMAADVCLTEPADVPAIIDGLMVGVGFFKSYDASLLDRGDYAGLTAWINDISTLRLQPVLAGVTTVGEWCSRLQAAGVAITMSSGTSGHPSFVPRDAATLSALRHNGRCYSMLALGGYQADSADFDALLLTRTGGLHGLDAVASGLATMADRAVYVGGEQQGEFDVAAFHAALELIDAAIRGRRRMLVFGSPPAVARLCDAILATSGSRRLPETAMLVTGGGWKTAVGEQLRSSDFSDRVTEALGIPTERTIDVYGLSECNAYLLRCSHGRYHVPPVLEAVVLDDDLRALTASDVTGHIGLLDPFAFSYPGFLLTGDWGRLVSSRCGCGLAGSGFVGDIIRAPGREAKGCAGVPAGMMM